MPTITAATYTKNNAHEVEDCLKSLQWADEVLLVDSGSTDGTVEIAEKYAHRVLYRDWTGFRDQLEFIQQSAKGDWVFLLDADERATPELAEEAREAVSRPDPPDLYEIPRMTRYLGRWLKHGEWYPDYVRRLYQRGKGKYVREPHAWLETDGPVARLKTPILHMGYDDLADQVETMRKYSEWSLAELKEKGVKHPLPHMLFRPIFRFLKGYVFKAGFLDGRQGLIVAVMTSYYVFLKYAKLWEEMQKQK